MKILVFHVNAHQKEISAEEDFNNALCRRTYSVNTNQLLFPATPVISKSLLDKAAMVAGIAVMHGVSNRDS